MSRIRSTSDVFHAWANQTRESARSASVSFQGRKLYSYAACIAVICKDGKTIAFSERRYSNTTASHISKAMSAASHFQRVTVFYPNGTSDDNLRWGRNRISELLEEANHRKGIRQTTRDRLRSEALHIADSVNKWLEAEYPESTDRINTENLDAVREEIERVRLAEEQMRVERMAQRQRELAESLQEWRQHIVLAGSRLYEIPPALRLSKDGEEVQTSHGARIPTRHAIRIWPVIQSCRANGQEYNDSGARTIHLGDFKLSKITVDGGLVVGCHTIAYEEVEGIAKQLGLIKEEAVS